MPGRWDGHGGGSGAGNGEWETRIIPDDAAAFAIERGAGDSE